MRQGQIFDYIYHIETEGVTHFFQDWRAYVCIENME